MEKANNARLYAVHVQPLVETELEWTLMVETQAGVIPGSGETAWS